MTGRDTLQPNPKGPLPPPESYVSASDGPNPERPGLTANGTDSPQVPVAGLTVNVSPIPRIAPLGQRDRRRSRRDGWRGAFGVSAALVGRRSGSLGATPRLGCQCVFAVSGAEDLWRVRKLRQLEKE